jgi:hypothetical protein
MMAEETRARDAWLAERLVDLPAEDIQKLREAVDVLDRLGSE